METVKDINGEHCLQFKVLTEPKPVPFRRYVFIPWGNTYYITGTGQWRTHGYYKIHTRNTYYRSLQILYLRLENPRLILRHRRCFELSMEYSMKFSDNTGKASEILMTNFWRIIWIHWHICYPSSRQQFYYDYVCFTDVMLLTYILMLICNFNLCYASIL